MSSEKKPKGPSLVMIDGKLYPRVEYDWCPPTDKDYIEQVSKEEKEQLYKKSFDFGKKKDNWGFINFLNDVCSKEPDRNKIGEKQVACMWGYKCGLNQKEGE